MYHMAPLAVAPAQPIGAGFAGDAVVNALWVSLDVGGLRIIGHRRQIRADDEVRQVVLLGHLRVMHGEIRIVVEPLPLGLSHVDSFAIGQTGGPVRRRICPEPANILWAYAWARSEEHTSELQSRR